MSTTTSTINLIQQQIVEEFALFPSWMERYEYIIELGKGLDAFPEDAMTEANQVRGCQSQVWLLSEAKDNLLYFKATSDALIVKGLIALLLRVFNAQPAQAILETKLDFISEIGLDKHLSMNRSNGLTAMISKIKGVASSQ